MDMLIRLYALGDNAAWQARAQSAGVTIRRALSAERRPVVDWVERRFGGGWAGEAGTAFARTPTGCLVAQGAGEIVGFAVWDVAALGYFGPGGVDEKQRRRGIGAALLHEALLVMRQHGYGYAIVGGAADPAFYTRVAGAIPIPDSSPGIYAGLIKTAIGCEGAR